MVVKLIVTDLTKELKESIEASGRMTEDIRVQLHAVQAEMKDMRKDRRLILIPKAC